MFISLVYDNMILYEMVVGLCGYTYFRKTFLGEILDANHYIHLWEII